MNRKSLLSVCLLSIALAGVCSAQVPVSSGPTYTQNFDGLSNTGTANTWTENTTMLGWYASRSIGSPAGPWAAYRAGTGSDNAGAIYSFGTTTDRAFGSVASGTPGNIAFGLRLFNDTDQTVSIALGYTGEQWRNGGNVDVQSLTFGYRKSGSSITSSDAGGVETWTAVPSLDFNSPTVGAASATLDGNAAANRQVFAPTSITTLLPGEELFVRWFDLNNLGNDHGLAVDDVSISFASVPEPSTAALAVLAGLCLFGRARFKRSAPVGGG